jgi:transposase
VLVEKLPWSNGKEHCTGAFQLFLCHWARRLSWQQVANEFRVSWNIVYRAVKQVVSWGLVHRDLGGITSIGVDELRTWKGHRYVTMVYQIDAHCKRLLWICKDRTAESFAGFFDMLGSNLCASIQYVCSDMWKGYLQVVRERLPHAVHILDRFHIVANLNKALDEVRADEARRLKLAGDDQSLKRTRWCLLKKPRNLTGRQRGRLRELLSLNLKTVRAYLLARDFQHFWTYSHPNWAGRFLNAWCQSAMRSRIEPIKKIAKQLRSHRELILNWFKTKKLLSSGVVEALNNNAKLTMRKAYGFRSFQALEIALFHTLGNLPEPPITNKFW